MSKMWKRSMVELVRHPQTKGRVTDRPHLVLEKEAQRDDSSEKGARTAPDAGGRDVAAD
jgi:hypothetical protein